MKELTAVARNVFYRNNDGEFKPNVEIILCLSEPTYQLSTTLELIQVRDVESVRFVTNLAGVHGLRDDIDEIIKEMETGLI